jgi:4-alpha-glucanotransferase
LKKQGKWETDGRFVRGGHWRGFLAKYEESNLMHKKMLMVSNQVAAYEAKHPHQQAEMEAAKDRLYASQCNCPYWHGVFGGLYLPHIRQAVYEAMITASRQTLEMGTAGVQIYQIDFDADGRAEVILQNAQTTAIVKPSLGGMLVSLALNQPAFELTDTLSRRREGYHRKLDQAVKSGSGSESETASIHDLVLTKESGLDKFLRVDPYLKRCLIDHFFGPEVSLETFDSGAYVEQGDILLKSYAAEVSADRVKLTCEGTVRGIGKAVPVRVMKTIKITPGSSGLTVEYQVQTLSNEEIDTCLAIENNFSFQAGHAEDRYVVIDNARAKPSFLDSTGRRQGVRSIGMVDEWRSLAVAVTSDTKAEVWHLPIFTVSLSEGGFERVYQGTTLVHKFSVRLGPKPVHIGLAITAGAIDSVITSAGSAVSAATR